MDEKGLPLRNLDQIKEDTKETSDDILRILDLDGKVTKPGPLPASCSEYSEKAYRASHPWSVYDAPVAQMKEAMERLGRNLPKHGWTIVKDGRTESRQRTPRSQQIKGGINFLSMPG